MSDPDPAAPSLLSTRARRTPAELSASFRSDAEQAVADLREGISRVEALVGDFGRRILDRRRPARGPRRGRDNLRGRERPA